MMRRYTIIIVLLISLFSSAWAGTKLSPDKYHFLGGWGSVGYSTLLQQSYAKPAAGIQPALGLGYRLYYNGFTFTTGVEAQYGYMTNRIGRSDLTLSMIDTEGEPFTMHAIVQDTKDYMRTVNIAVPLAIGAEHKYFYIQAGAKFALNLYGTASTASSASTKADYERYIGFFENMPNHQLENGQQLVSEEYSMSLLPSLLLTCELGARVDQIVFERGADVAKHNYRMYLGLFAEYGLLNVHKDVSYGEALAYRQTEQGVKFFVVPAMLNDDLRSVQVNPLTVGVRFSVFFRLPEPKTCVICNEMARKQHNQHYNSRGRVAW